MSKLDQEVDMDTVAYRLHVCRRELAYHKAICAAAEEGLDDCIDLHFELEGEGIDPDAQEHIATWSHRVHLANLSVSEVSQDVAVQARILCEITKPVPADEPSN